MQIAFVGTSPSDTLSRGLMAAGFPFQLLRKLPPNPPFDVLVISPRTPTALKELPLVDSPRRPWVTVVLPDEWVKDPQWQTALLAQSVVDEILPAPQWETLLWFSLHRAAQIRDLRGRAAALERDNEELQEHIRTLSQSSEKLIAQFERNVGLAGNIQRSLLPKRSPDIPGITLAVKYLPASGIGGDYYDIFEFGDRKRFGFLLADSKSHGMAATLLSVLLKVRLEEMKDRFPDAKSFMDFLNTEVRNLHQDDAATLSLLFGILDRSSLTFHFCIAGQLRPFLWRNGTPVDLSHLPKAPPLGGMDHFGFREEAVKLEPGDLLMMHTDGLHAVLGENPTSPVDALFQRHPTADPLEAQNELLGRIDAYKASQPIPDDITLIHLSVDKRALYLATPETKTKSKP